VRGKPEKFAEHYLQARLFFDSQSSIEKAHIFGGFRFVLCKVTVPAIRERMVASLLNVSKELANAVAQGLGIEPPAPMPIAMRHTPKPEISTSPALSLTARPGSAGIRTRKIALLIADGAKAEPIAMLVEAISGAGAVARLLSTRLGTVRSIDGQEFAVDATLENMPSVLFDALVLPDGAEAVNRLSKDGRTLEFLKDQYRHGKTILVGAASAKLLEDAGVPLQLPTGKPDPGLIVGTAGQMKDRTREFLAAVAKHRHPGRAEDPPVV
jgi:catalase